METVEIRAFVAASNTGTVIDAATALNLTPAPVSRAIKRLETELGGDLFRRDYHHLVLTDLGRQLLPHAVASLVQMRTMRTTSADAPPLRLGATLWAPERFVSAFRDAAPDGNQHSPLRRHPSAALVRSLAHGEIDAALVHDSTTWPGITTRVVARYRMSFLASPDHPLVQRTDLTMADLTDVPIAIMAGLHRRLSLAGVLRQLQDDNIGRIIDIQSDDWTEMPALIRARNAITLGSMHERTPMLQLVARRDLVPLRISDDGPSLNLCLAWRALDDAPGTAVHTTVTRMRPFPGEEPAILA